MESAENPFERVTLDQLRTRRSAKWQVFPPDVLPLWVAEMDTIIAEPITEAVHRALTAGDTGYPHGSGYADAMAAFARRRWGWEIDPSLVRPVTDVMSGLVETLRLVTRTFYWHDRAPRLLDTSRPSSTRRATMLQ